MPNTARKLATYADVLAAPEHLVAEIVAGELHTSPRPAFPHANAASSLGIELGNPFHRGRGGPGGWWILDEPECHLGGHVLVPDIAGWRRERLPVLPQAAWTDIPPDWVCEVLSPATQRLDRMKKMPAYAEFGVQYLWLVDPIARTLEAFQCDGGRWVLLGNFVEDGMIRVPPFDAAEIDLGALWA